ncbi:MAG: hypothetical protein HC853_15765 [Anaerolineae bacterium]|nr:hypothetical protein [Anaerolineae bacterium]
MLAWLTTWWPRRAPIITGSVGIQYLSGEVIDSGADESQLAVYFYSPSGWVELPTFLDAKVDFASASSRGPGIYALLASVPLRLANSGWNLIAYPILGARPVTQALHSINGSYTTVYGFEVNDADDPWKVYDVAAPSYVNDLSELAFGQSYWVRATRPITLYLDPSKDNALAANALEPMMSTPSALPFTIYGVVRGDLSLKPAAGMSVVATINGEICGETETMSYQGQIVYTLNVLADIGGDTAGCGVVGRSAEIEINGKPLGSVSLRESGQVRQANMPPRLYLPLVRR